MAAPSQLQYTYAVFLTRRAWKSPNVSRRVRAEVMRLEPRLLLSGNLVFDDEFNQPVGTQPNGADWTIQNQGTDPNNSAVHYVNTLSTLKVVSDPAATDGRALAMSLYPDPSGNGTWDSAKIRTAIDPVGGSLLYGHIEARIKLPGGPNGQGQGIWPAFWMLGNNIGQVGWPACGEVDIMEARGSAPGTNQGSMHASGYNLTGFYNLPTGQSFYSAYHTFAIDWGPNYVKFSVDGNIYEAQTIANMPPGKVWAFNHPFYLILNVAEGGGYGGPTGSNSTFPQTMLVDYARAYSLNPLANGLVPAGWSDVDIGSPRVPGIAGFDGGTWTVGGGGSDIWSHSAQFNFESSTLTGDSTLVTRVLSMSSGDPWAKAGIMFRNDASAASAFADVELTPGNGVSFQWRASAGALAQSSTASGVNGPLWVKLTRAANNFSAFDSNDGKNWTQIGASEVIAIGSSAMAGLAVTAHDNAALNVATFSGVASVEAPTNLQVTAVSGLATQLSWTPSPDAAGYIIERGTTGGPFVAVNALGAGAAGYTDTGLTPGTLYVYRVTAFQALAQASAAMTPSVYTFLAGDANGDGKVDFSDFNLLVANFGKTGVGWAGGDFNGDGIVNFADFNLLASNLGKSLPSLPPASLLLAGSSATTRHRPRGTLVPAR